MEVVQNYINCRLPAQSTVHITLTTNQSQNVLSAHTRTSQWMTTQKWRIYGLFCVYAAQSETFIYR